MNELVTLISHLSAQATGALISAIWQGALLAALVAVCLRFFPGLSAAARSVIWLNVFILLALLHLLPIVSGSPSAPHLASHALKFDSRWSLAIAGLSLALSIFRAVQLAVSAIHLHALTRRATPIAANAELDPLLGQLLVAPFNRRVQLSASDGVARPSVLGFFHPRILIPPALLQGLSEAELRQVVIHEMEHLHRGDDWTNLLQKLALVLFPLNPALLWVERRLCAERELACDDGVLRSGSGRKAYALCLAHLAEYSLMHRGFSLVLGAWERRPELVRRVQRILTQPARTMGRKPALAVCGALLTGVFACTLTLANSPQFVSFVPSTHRDQQASVQPDRTRHQTDSAGLESASLVHTLGGSAHMVQTWSPCEGRPRAISAKAVIKRHNLPRLQPDRLASLRTQPLNTGDFTVRAAMAMARMTEMEAQERLAYTAVREQQIGRQRIVQAVYVVRTPDGWLIIQI